MALSSTENDVIDREVTDALSRVNRLLACEWERLAPMSPAVGPLTEWETEVRDALLRMDAPRGAALALGAGGTVIEYDYEEGNQ